MRGVPAGPQAVDHEVVGDGAGIHPADGPGLVQPGDVLDLEQQAGRVVGIGLVVGDLEGEAAVRRKEVAFHGEHPAVEPQRHHAQAAAGEGAKHGGTEEAAIARVAFERGAFLALPAERLQREEVIHPGIDVTGRLQRGERHAPDLLEPCPPAPEVLPVLAGEARLQEGFGRCGEPEPGPAAEIVDQHGRGFPAEFGHHGGAEAIGGGDDGKLDETDIGRPGRQPPEEFVEALALVALPDQRRREVAMRVTPQRGRRSPQARPSPAEF